MSDTPVIKEGVTLIPIHDAAGNETHLIPIHDRLTYVNGRVCKGEKGFYYKGAGCTYQHHHVLDPKGYSNPQRAEVFYYGYRVSTPNWVGKFGIFPQKMQPFFSDLAGACGPKELKIIKNSEQFMMSSVRVDNVVNWTEDSNGQYYFVLRYLCGREKYLDNPNPKLLLELLDYMLTDGWCAPWDKGFIGDITNDGRISDVADLFRSTVLKHKLGTVYAAFYSLWKRNKEEFSRVADELGWNNIPRVDGLWAGVYIVSLAARFLGTMKITQPKRSDVFEIADFLIGDLLVKGRNCAAVEDSKHGKRVAKEYYKRFRRVYYAEKNSGGTGL